MERKVAAGTLLGVMLLFCVPLAAGGQQPATSNSQPHGKQSTAPGSQPTTLDDTLEAGDDEVAEPVRRLVNWNEYDGRLFSIRMGGGALYEYAAFSQNEASKEQIALFPKPKLRDARFLFKGRLKFDRATTWSCGVMWDGALDKFLIRET